MENRSVVARVRGQGICDKKEQHKGGFVVMKLLHPDDGGGYMNLQRSKFPERDTTTKYILYNFFNEKNVG